MHCESLARARTATDRSAAPRIHHVSPVPATPQRLVVSVAIASLLFAEAALSIEIQRIPFTCRPMPQHFSDHRSFWSRLVLAVGSVGLICVAPQRCSAEIVAYLTETRAGVGERFETDFVLSGTSDMIGDEIELINLDVVGSSVNSVPISDFTRIRFDASPRFAPWHDGQQFGGPQTLKSVITLDAFATGSAVAFPIEDTNPFLIGTLTFDYGGLGLQVGDSISLNILGTNDGSATRTTSVGIRASGASDLALVNPDFSSPAGSQLTTFTITTAIPEPGSAVILSLACIGVIARRRPRSQLVPSSQT